MEWRQHSYVFTLFFGLFCVSVNAMADPRTPVNDGEVLETVSRSSQYDSNVLRSLRKQLKTQPQNAALAAQLATSYIQIAREATDVRYYGYAQAVLKPWWKQDNPPTDILFLRATLRQHDHHFNQASDDLKQLLKQQPKHTQAWLTLAIIQQVQGHYNAARASCSALARTGASWLSNLCHSQVLSLTGSAERAYELQQALALQVEKKASLAQWVYGLSAETALHLGNHKQAEMHFKAALDLPLRDAYLLRVYSDFLLDQKRSKEVLKLLEDEAQDDALLLRLAIAAKDADKAGLSKGYQQQLKARYKAASLRGSKLHARDEALFLLQFGGDKEAALKLTLENWQQQKEPDDALILLRAAVANQSGDHIQMVRDWMVKNKLQDKRLSLLLESQRKI